MQNECVLFSSHATPSKLLSGDDKNNMQQIHCLQNLFMLTFDIVENK